ncbi:MAG: hypothetical protein IJ668_10190 [Selenomonadaceae bacterium]|nr:hypothetical protein [Selenomonadaceae bacterium]
MADIEFKSQKAKTDEYNADIATAEEYGLEATAKGVINVPTSASSEVDGSTIDVSGSGFFKTVSVAGGFDGTIAITGSSTVANTFYAGGKGSTLFGDGGEASSKPVADKLYGGGGSDAFVYAVSGGKDAIYNYSSGNDTTADAVLGGDDVIVLQGYNAATQTLSFVDKSGGIVLTIAQSDQASVAKNSVLTVDGKTASAGGGFKFVDETGAEILTYGQFASGVFGYGMKGTKQDTATITVNGAASYDNVIDANKLSSTAKNISVVDSTEEGAEAQAFHIIGNGANANSITIGAGGGTLDGGIGTKATADKLFGTSTGGEVTFVFDGVMGGKDVIGDAKLTQYNYKAGDKIVVTNGTVVESGDNANIANSNGDVVITIDKNNTLTIKNGVGKPINIYAVDDDGNIEDTPYIENWGDTLQTGLTYDAKLSKVSADDAAITAQDPTASRTVEVTVGSIEIDGVTYPTKIDSVVSVYETVTIGGEDASYATSVKEIDLSASSAPVLIDTSEEDHAGVTTIKMGKDGGTVTGNDAVTQTFSAGAGADTFIVSTEKLKIEKYKGDTINDFGLGDVLKIDGYSVDDETAITVTEKGKDLIVALDGSTFLTLKNAASVFDGSNGNQFSILDEDGNVAKLYPKKITGVGYGTTSKGAADKTSMTLSGSVGEAVVSAEDFGGATIKKIDATAVTAVSGNKGIEIDGSSGANTMLAPTAAKIATTLNGGAGNDALTGGTGQTTFVFQAQTKGKKDTISNYKTGDVIVIDQESLESGTGASFGSDDEGHGSITYNETVDGFNDSKSAVVITINKANSITVNDAAGKQIILQDGVGGDTYSFGHVLPSTDLGYDSKNTSVTIASGASYKDTINLGDYGTYYSTVKKVDLTGNTGAAAIIGNTLANELIAGNSGGTLDGGSVDKLTDAKGNALKPTADKLTGGDGNDVFVYDIGYGKDSFLKFGAGDQVSLGADIGKENLSIVDKGNVLTISIVDADFDTEKGAVKTAANSSFTVTKTDSSVPVTFVGDGLGGSFVYGSLPSGVSMDTKYGTLSVDSTASAGVYVDASAINSQPKVIDARAATGGSVLIGNANADNIYGGGTADGAGSTLFGGTAGTKATKDALYGSDGKDYFLFTSQGGEKGKETDIVYNYKAGDVIVLDKAPDTFKADGKTFTLTWNDTPESGKATQSTLVINGANSDNGAMKKFDNIDSNVSVTFAIGEFIDDNGNIDLTAALDATDTYTFKVDAKATDADVKAATAALKKGVEWGDWADYLVEEEESEELAATSDQYAASAWFEEAVSTDNVIGSELDSILDVKAITTDALEQVNGDAFFTGIGQQADNSLLTSYAARHRAKK